MDIQVVEIDLGKDGASRFHQGHGRGGADEFAGQRLGAVEAFVVVEDSEEGIWIGDAEKSTQHLGRWLFLAGADSWGGIPGAGIVAEIVEAGMDSAETQVSGQGQGPVHRGVAGGEEEGAVDE